VGRLPEPVRLKRVLVLMELEDGSIGAVYSEDFHPDALVDVQRMEHNPRSMPWDRPLDPEPRFHVRVGDMKSLVVHDPGFHDPAVESMAQAVMNQWREGQ
jgi:hypothetical protein